MDSPEDLERIRRVAADLDREAEEKQAQDRIEKKLAAKIEHVRGVAARAAQRLIDARPADGMRPSNTLELLDMILYMAKTPKKWGVFLTEPEKRAIKAWDRIARLMLIKRKELGTLKPEDSGQPG